MYQLFTVSSAQNSRVEICESMRQITIGTEGVLVSMGLHILHNDGSADSNGVTAGVVFEGLVLQVALKIFGCIVGSPKEVSATNLCCVAVWVGE